MKHESQTLDEIDKRLLELLQSDGRASVASLAEALEMSEAPCWRRVKRLFDTGYLTGVKAIADRRKLGLDVHAYVLVRIVRQETTLAHDFEESVRSISGVLTCHNVTGEFDYILQVVAENLDHYAAFTNRLANLPGVATIQSCLNLREVKWTTELPSRASIPSD